MRRTTVLALVALSVAGLAMAAFGTPLVNGDSLYALIWGRELLHADLDSFFPGPTPHPLTILVGAGTAALGADGSYVATYVIFGPLALGALVAVSADIASRLAPPVAGVVAAVLLLTSPPLLWWAAAAWYDVAFVVLMLVAVDLWIARDGKGLAPLLPLAVAGLVRPEAWVIAGLALLSLARRMPARRRLAGALLVSLPALAWVTMDALVTGDPLWSFHVTDAGSENLYRQFSPGANLGEGAKNLLLIVGPASLLLAPVGIGRLVRARAREGVAPVAVLGLTGAAYLALVSQGLASNARYLLLPGCLLMTLAATGPTPGSSRGRAGAALVVAAMALLLIQVLARADAPFEIRREFRMPAERNEQAAELVSRPEVARWLRECRTVAVPSRRLVPVFAHYSGREPDQWKSDPDGRSNPDLFLAPGTTATAQAFLTRRRFDDDARFSVPRGLVPGPRTREWRLFIAPRSPCVTR